MVVRRVPKLARYQTALRPALSILRLLARSVPAGKGGKCEHSRILRPNLVALQSHRFPVRAINKSAQGGAANTSPGPDHSTREGAAMASVDISRPRLRSKGGSH